ncbi:hypothetical protein VNI00_015059 [Paramarasmius palmivorus]|uniref:Uncharacterized protein n=1 Tax=Paramarasmius palmivorus TaxID=297713 RepID=A0AAW0BPE1_9AGAR
MALPDEYIREGIRIGDVGIIHHDTPFDFLFNITCSADHPINYRGVPNGFIPVPQDMLDITHVHQYRDGDSHITGPGHTVSRTQTASVSLAERTDRAYDFTSSSHQGAILMLPEGSCLSKVENKSLLRDYAKSHAKQWFSYATGTRGREFSDDTNSSLYLVTGHEKCTSWGIASFFSPTSSERGVSLPFNVFRDGYGERNIYGWGQDDGRCSSRCYPNTSTPATTGKLPRNQTVFMHGFKVSKKRKSTKVKIRDVTGNKVKAERILDLKPQFPDAQGGHSQASSSAYSAFGYTSGGYTRLSSGAEVVEDGNGDYIVDGTSIYDEKVFHPCDLIGDMMYAVASEFGRSESIIAISHDEDWISLYHQEELHSSAGLPSVFDFLTRFSATFSVVIDQGFVYTESSTALRRKTAHDPTAGKLESRELSHDINIFMQVMDSSERNSDSTEETVPTASKSRTSPIRIGYLQAGRSQSRTPPPLHPPSGGNYSQSSPRAMSAPTISYNLCDQPFSRYEQEGHHSPQYTSCQSSGSPQQLHPGIGVETPALKMPTPASHDSYQLASTSYHDPGWSQSLHSTAMVNTPVGSTSYSNKFVADLAHPQPYQYSQYNIHQYPNSASRQISPAGSHEHLSPSTYQGSNAHLSPPAIPENSDDSASARPPSESNDSGSLLFRHPQQPQRLYSHQEQMEFFKAALSLPFSVTPSPFIPQAMYKPHTNSDRRQYVEEVQLDPPIYFWADNPSECGISLTDALHSRVRRLENRDETVFEGRGPSVSIRLEWPGYRQWSRQIPTKDFKSPPGPITKAKLAKNVAKCVQRFIAERQNQHLEEDAHQRWRVGGPGSSYIKLEELVLVSMHHVSMGSWQPHLRLCRESRASVYR